jgi:hypothetical protein
MRSFKKLKFLRVFSDGSTSSVYKNFMSTKNSKYFFYQKDFLNYYIYKKNNDKLINLNVDTKNLRYRKDFLNK